MYNRLRLPTGLRPKRNQPSMPDLNTPAKIARHFAIVHPQLSGQLEVRDFVLRAKGPKARFSNFVVTGGKSAQLGEKNAKDGLRFYNGQCPHCSGFYVDKCISRWYYESDLYGKQFMSHELLEKAGVRPIYGDSRLYGIGRFVQTIACNECGRSNGWGLGNEMYNNSYTFDYYRVNIRSMEQLYADHKWVLQEDRLYDWQKESADFAVDCRYAAPIVATENYIENPDVQPRRKATDRIVNMFMAHEKIA